MLLNIDVSVRKSFILVWLLLLIVPSFSHAHNSGNSYEEQKDGFLIDVGYSPLTLIAGERARFDFSIYSLTATTSPKDLFTDVWIQISKDDELHFSSNLNQPTFGPTALNILLVEAGEYEIYVRFQQGSTLVTDTTFTVSVEAKDIVPTADPSIPLSYYSIAAWIVLVFSWLVWLLYGRWTRVK
jgi:hypothetical protein